MKPRMSSLESVHGATLGSTPRSANCEPDEIDQKGGGRNNCTRLCLRATRRRIARWEKDLETQLLGRTEDDFS